MRITQLKTFVIAAAIAAGLAGSGRLVREALAEQPATVAQAPEESQTPAADEARPPAKLDLTPESFAKLHALIRPHDNEWRHLKVNWLTDVVAARKKAAAEDKPIVICYTGGAGYNEPLGVC
jgi:hypothetical protein